jgi:cytochrome b involved in lipid metabolism
MKRELLISILLGVVGAGAIGFFLLQKPSSGISTPNQGKNVVSVTEVSKHATEQDCWVIVNNNVYDVTSFIPNHSGGPQAIIPFCGKDAKQAFDTRNGRGPHPGRALEFLQSMLVGTIQ